jgi:hypothetical protein
MKAAIWRPFQVERYPKNSPLTACPRAVLMRPRYLHGGKRTLRATATRYLNLRVTRIKTKTIRLGAL